MRFLLVTINRGLLLGAAVALAGCASTPMHPVQTSEVDTVTGQSVISAGDIAIVGQLVSHSIMDLPEVADAPSDKPPLVRFAGVTSQINGPIDTSIYTALLRDRILLLCREKLRFVERQLPALGSHKHHGGPLDVDTDADYKIAAQLRGNYDDDTYLVEVEFIDIHTGESLFTGSYRISREVPQAPQSPTEEPQPIGNPNIESTSPNPTPVDVDAPPPPPSQNPGGNSGLQ